MHNPMLRCAVPLAVLGAGLVLAGAADAQTWRTVTSARQVWGTEPLDVHIRYGAGELNLKPADEPMLYQMEMRFDEENYAPLTEYDSEKRRLRLGVEGKEGRRSMRLREGSHATIALTRKVPLDLDLEFGAGEADIDLGGIALRRLDLSTGASETRIRFGERNPVRAEQIRIQAGAAELEVIGLGNTRAERFSFEGGVGSTLLDFSGEWDRSATASVEMGIGSVTLRLPRGLGVRVNKDSFLTSFDSQGLVKRGSSYFSTDWNTAAHRLTIDVDAAFGSIEVEWTG
jgi:hypothetical protein